MTAVTAAFDRPDAVIARAAQATGVDFDYLVRTAARESGFDPRAQARTSSAAGLFQFIEQTWLGVMSRHGAQHGYAAEAAAIERGSDGRFQVADPARRQAILDLRFDANAASLMAGELAAENAGVIESRIGRPATSGELYAAHFLGAGAAAELIRTAESSPSARADELFPQAARANRNVFFEGGRARSARELLDRLTGEPGARSAPAQWRAPAASDRAAQSRMLTAEATPSPAERFPAEVTSGARRYGYAPTGPVGLRAGAELSPAVVEILASLDAPARAGRRRS